MDKKLDTPSTIRHGLRDQYHFCTRLRRDVSQLRFLFQISINQNLAEADVKFELVKFCYIFFILYAINDILLKTVKNNIVACLCNAFYTNVSLWNDNKYNTIDIFLFPIKDPFRAEQLTKNLIQWLWIDYIDWKMTTFYEAKHHLTCVVLSHSTAGGDIYCLFPICCLRMK